MEARGYDRGSCLTRGPDGEVKRACELTLCHSGGEVKRLIKSIQLSRPEHYLSIYQSGCNFSCLKCHSAEFSKTAQGKWFSPEDLSDIAAQYAEQTNYFEPRERATAFHAEDLCRSCGMCVLEGRRSSLCPGVLSPEQVLLSPQGFGPARNIIAFTGGDLTCNPEFYARTSSLIKERVPDLWVLIETNGFGLIPENLLILKEAGVDAFWLDIKAYDERVHRELTGTPASRILALPEKIMGMGFTLEVLSLFIPTLVEEDQIEKIAGLLARVSPDIPFTILAFFPAHRLAHLRSPTLREMLRAHDRAKSAGLRNIRLGNIGIFAKTYEDYELVKAHTGRV
ncbi:MAG: radical SAM protein [bacterium]